MKGSRNGAGLLSGFSVYFGTSIVNRAIPFVLLPVMTRYLSPAEYGALGVFQVAIWFAVPVVGMQLQANITRLFFKESKEKIALLIYNLLLVMLLSAGLALLAVVSYVLSFHEPHSVSRGWVLAVPVIALMNTVNEFHLTILRNERRALEYGLYEIARTVLQVGVTLALVVGAGAGWEGGAYGILASSLILGVSGAFRLWSDGYITPVVDKAAIRQALGVSLPLVPHAVGAAAIALSDRIFLSRLLGDEAVGVYIVGYQFGMFVSLIVTAFNRSWSPWVFEKLAANSESARRLVVRSSYFYFAGILAVVILVSAFGRVAVPMLTTPAFHAAIPVVKWVALAFAFQGMYTIVFPYLVFTGRTAPLGLITTAATASNLVANWVLIQVNGVVGAGQAAVLAYLIMFVSVWAFSQKAYPMPWRLWRAA